MVPRPDDDGGEQLHYGRVSLDAGTAPVRFATGCLETGFVALRGRAEL